MPAGRPPKPLEDHELDGTLRADRHGEAVVQFRADGYGEKPADLSPPASVIWDFIINDLHRANVVKRIDSIELAAGCEWFALYKTNRETLAKFAPDAPEYWRLLLQVNLCWKSFDAVASKFGLTPVARAGLRLPQESKAKGVMTRSRTA